MDHCGLEGRTKTIQLERRQCSYVAEFNFLSSFFLGELKIPKGHFEINVTFSQLFSGQNFTK